MQPIITIHDLSYHYPDGKQALYGINLQIMPGEKVALLGANGAGKSTLLLHLNGILMQNENGVRVGELVLNSETVRQIRGRVGLVFQNPDDQLFSPTVREDIAFGPYYQGLGQLEIDTRVREALNAVHMAGYEDRNPYHLSGGEKKRIAIATVLSMRPDMLVFDEPTAGLDPRARRRLIELLTELPQTMLIATHDLALARQITPRVVVLDGGQVVADGPSAELLDNHDLMFQHGLA
jgi:cobalt/nickel transport system ATP-binding protein